ncbi:hypothetical protein HY36_01480 [Hyphomonas atlantica]|uniref:Uncharacterized protein n=1 Tax=Hyphomonas atlantica TaxID=1280948 RepID=A0A059EBJ2_9PROT|nr:hypothetical protein HY36_01480 [Hyphomonas atlantica]MAM07245.1 hypothetical protein [Hyphomonas sp.]
MRASRVTGFLAASSFDFAQAWRGQTSHCDVPEKARSARAGLLLLAASSFDFAQDESVNEENIASRD